MLRRNSPVIKSVESVLRPEEQVMDDGTGTRLTDRTRKLIPETR